MPNLNLIEEEGGAEGTMQPVAAKKKSGGGGSKGLIIVLVLLLVGGGVFALNKFGIIKLWGKKKPAVSQIQEEAFPAETPQYVDTTAAMDTTGIAFVDTPPIEEPKKETAKRAMGGTMEGAKLAEMKGRYTIQVSSWRDEATAQMYVKRLEDAGYPAYVQRRGLKDGDWFSVRIGRYPSIKQARRAVEDFALEIQSHYWIDRVRL